MLTNTKNKHTFLIVLEGAQHAALGTVEMGVMALGRGSQNAEPDKAPLSGEHSIGHRGLLDDAGPVATAAQVTWLCGKDSVLSPIATPLGSCRNYPI